MMFLGLLGLYRLSLLLYSPPSLGHASQIHSAPPWRTPRENCRQIQGTVDMVGEAVGPGVLDTLGEPLPGASGMVRSARAARGRAVGPAKSLIVFGASPSVVVVPGVSVGHGVVVSDLLMQV